jgi:hypothetical protein
MYIYMCFNCERKSYSPAELDKISDYYCPHCHAENTLSLHREVAPAMDDYLYLCDEKINGACPKTSCQGDCFYTKEARYAMKKVMMIMPRYCPIMSLSEQLVAAEGVNGKVLCCRSDCAWWQNIITPVQSFKEVLCLDPRRGRKPS